MKNDDVPFWPLVGRAIVTHTVTYVIMGILAASLLDYESALARPCLQCWMRQVSDPMIMAGPLFQPLRGVLFALAIYPIRAAIFARKRGALVLFWLLVALGVMSTFGPSPGSVEGLVYTVIPVRDQLRGYLEVVPQAGLFAYGLVYWTNHPEQRWFRRAMITAFVMALGLPLVGLLAGGRSG